MKMKRLMTMLLIGATLICGKTAKLHAYTAADFCGDDKFCTQVFYGNEITGTSVIAKSTWTTCTTDDAGGSKFKCNLCDWGEVSFTIEGENLSLDNINSKNGIKLSDGTYIRTVQYNTYIKDRQGFKDKQSEFKGVISKINGIITVTFNNPVCLQLRKRNRETNADLTWTDFCNTYKQIIFKIYPKNGNMICNNENYPIYTYNEGNDIFLKNFMGSGEHFSNFINPDKSTINEGIKINLLSDKDYKLYNQIYSGSISPSHKTTSDGINDGPLSGGIYWFKLKSINAHNQGIYDIDNSSDIIGNYASTYATTSGWHKNHGGKLDVKKTVKLTADWRTYDVNLSNNSVSNQNQYLNNSIEFTIDATPEIEMTDPSYRLIKTYNSKEIAEIGIEISGNLSKTLNIDVVESADIMAYIGNPEVNVTCNDNFSDTEKGHANGEVLAEVNMETFSYDNYTALNTLGENWQNLGKSENQNLTFYVRLKLKDDSQTPESSKSKAAAQSKYAFVAMGNASIAPSILTDVDRIELSNFDVKTGKGTINVTNANNTVSIFDISGIEIYSGYDCAINVRPGVYFIKSGNKTRKVLVN